jgi:hypothetical protein
MSNTHSVVNDVDDIWGIWEHGLDKLHEFHNLANSLHPMIKNRIKLFKRTN